MLVQGGGGTERIDLSGKELERFLEDCKSPPTGDILDQPHFLFAVLPRPYEEKRVEDLDGLQASLKRAKQALQRRRFPPGIEAIDGKTFGSTWIGRTGEKDRPEMWRAHESGQFLCIAGFEEARSDRRRKCIEQTREQLFWNPPIDWATVPGVLCFVTLLDRLTMLHRFSKVYAETFKDLERVDVTVSLRRIWGYLGGILTDPNRELDQVMRATDDTLENTWRYSPQILAADPDALARVVAEWFLRRFGWNREVTQWIEREQKERVRG